MSSPGRFACMRLNVVASSSEWKQDILSCCSLYYLFSLNPTMMCACICLGYQIPPKMSLWSYNKLFQLFFQLFEALSFLLLQSDDILF